MLVDLHAHYPMRVVSDVTPETPLKLVRTVRKRPLRDKLRALVLRLLSTFFSHRHPWTGYRITVEGMRKGGVGVALSVLTRPLDEFDLSRPYGSSPEPAYYQGLLRDLEDVENEVARYGRDTARMVHDRRELDQAIADGAIAIVHCLEGGLSLGDRPEEIEANVGELAGRGVFYITLAHLIYRQVATNVSAFPFLSDRRYDWFFRQPKGEGLTERGVAALRAMVRHRIPLDIAHMRQDALDETWRLLDELDPERELPVLATHAGYRFGEQQYQLDKAALLQIKRRNGVVGLILAQHQLNDGLRDEPTESFKDSLEVIFAHVDKIAEVTGGFDHVALGTDFDGFIRPTLTGLEDMDDLARLEEALDAKYGANAELIKSGNALRVLRQAWR